jgi:hypothetical protein
MSSSRLPPILVEPAYGHARPDGRLGIIRRYTDQRQHFHETYVAPRVSAAETPAAVRPS